jgi:hypothetical protein
MRLNQEIPHHSYFQSEIPVKSSYLPPPPMDPIATDLAEPPQK